MLLFFSIILSGFFSKSTFSQIIPCHNLTSTYLSIFPKTQCLELLLFMHVFRFIGIFCLCIHCRIGMEAFKKRHHCSYHLIIPFSDAFQSQTSTNSYLFQISSFSSFLPDILSIKSQLTGFSLLYHANGNTKYPSFRIAYAPQGLEYYLK